MLVIPLTKPLPWQGYNDRNSGYIRTISGDGTVMIRESLFRQMFPESGRLPEATSGFEVDATLELLATRLYLLIEMTISSERNPVWRAAWHRYAAISRFFFLVVNWSKYQLIDTLIVGSLYWTFTEKYHFTTIVERKKSNCLQQMTFLPFIPLGIRTYVIHQPIFEQKAELVISSRFRAEENPNLTNGLSNYSTLTTARFISSYIARTSGWGRDLLL